MFLVHYVDLRLIYQNLSWVRTGETTDNFDTEHDVGGVGIIMSDAMVMYLAEAFAADVLEITLYMDNWRKFGFDLFYLLKREKDEKIVAKVKTGIAFFNYDTKKLARTPDEFKRRLEKMRANDLL